MTIQPTQALEEAVAAEGSGVAVEPSETPARRLFAEIIDPQRVRALRKGLEYLKTSHAVPWNDLYIATTVAGQTYRGILVGRADPDFMMRVAADPNDWIAIGAADDLPEDVLSGDELTITARSWR